MGGNLTQIPNGRYYYNNATTYSSQSGMNHYLAFDDAMNSWNNTYNTKVEMYKTQYQYESIIDLTSASLPNPKLWGLTEPYVGQTLLTDEQAKTTNWSWARCITNTTAAWSTWPSGASYTVKGRKLQAASAHEIGHALGLAHPGEDPFGWSSHGNKLMYSEPTLTYSAYNIYTPTSDEVAGVQAIYGTLQ